MVYEWIEYNPNIEKLTKDGWIKQKTDPLYFLKQNPPHDMLTREKNDFTDKQSSETSSS